MASTQPTGAGIPAGGARPARLELALVLLACTAVLFYRRPDAFLYPQFYCEDGTICFVCLRQGRLWAQICSPIQPYLHLPSDALALLFSLAPERYAPHCYAYCTLLIWLGLALFLYSRRLHLPYRALMALAVVLTPCTGNMIVMNLGYSHWFASMYLFLLALADDPQNRRQWAFDVALLVLIGLAGPFIVILLPLFVYRFWLRRSRASAVLLTVAALMSAVEFGVFLSSKWYRPGAANLAFSLSDPNWIGFFGNGLSGALLAGGRVLEIPHNSVLLAVFTAVLCTGLAAHAILRRDHSRIMLLLGGSAILLAAAYSWKGNPGVVPPGGHYYFVSLLSLFWALILTLPTERCAAVPAAALLAWCAGVSLLTSRTANVPDYHWQDECMLLDSPGDVTLPILPPGYAINLKNPVTSRAEAREEILLRGPLERVWSDVEPERQVIVQFETPRYASGLRIRFRAETTPAAKATEAPAEIVWTDSIARRTGGGKFSLSLPADGDEHQHTFVTAGPVGAISFKLDRRVTRFVLHEIVRLY
jgi:hypothetical protein